MRSNVTACFCQLEGCIVHGNDPCENLAFRSDWCIDCQEVWNAFNEALEAQA